MRLLICLPLLFGALLSAESANRLTLILQFENQPSGVSLQALGTELKTILASSGVRFHVDLRTQATADPVPGHLVVFKMKGSCNLNDVPVGALSDERGPLAMTHIVDGETLPFADVECDRVRQSIERTLGTANRQTHEVQYGVALARVMAHELYHMLGHSTEHTADGLTKRGLSSSELLGGRMLLGRPAATLVR